MPIRMVEDDPGSSNSGRPQRSSGRSVAGKNAMFVVLEVEKG